MKSKVACIGLFLAAGAAQGQWSDDFNRPDGPMGPNWTQTSGTWAILANQGMHTGTGVNTILTHNAANAVYAATTTTLDVFRPAGITSNAFVAAVIGLGGTDSILVKIQAQGAVNEFTNIGIYHKTSATGWGAWTGGLPFGALTAPFRSARLVITFPDPDTLKLDVDTNFDGIPDQTYLSPAVLTIAPNLGTGHGIGAWLAAASFDNWSVSGGTGGATGACCLPDGSCIITSPTACQAQVGIYRGDNTACATANCPQPATGACCLPAGCSVLTAAQCATQGGNYAGNNVTCAQANCPQPCANVSAAIGGPSQGWPSTHGQQTNRLFRDGVPDTCVLSAPGGAALAGVFTYDKYDFVNNSAAAACVTVDVNTACTGTNFIYAGAYIGGYNPANPDLNVVASLGGSPNPTGQMSFNVPAGVAFEVVFAEVTAGAGCPNYNFTVSGLSNCGGAQPCYANCDNSTIAPILNVSDFICFQTKYAAGDPYANCDGSTIPPVLNVSDFICYQTKYAAGCS